MSTAPLQQILAELDATRTEREQLYVHLHQNPELSFQEHATAATLHDVLTTEGVEVTQIGLSLIHI